jgi:hypothetical protein
MVTCCTRCHEASSLAKLWQVRTDRSARIKLFVQVIAEVKRRQFKQMLDAYEAAQREQVRAGGDQASGDDAAPTAR